jgi:hypothetical protein
MMINKIIMKNMKSKIKYLLTLVVLISTLSACDENWVDTKPNGEPTTAFFWKSEADVERALTAMYRPLDYEELGDEICSGCKTLATIWLQVG